MPKPTLKEIALAAALAASVGGNVTQLADDTEGFETASYAKKTVLNARMNVDSTLLFSPSVDKYNSQNSEPIVCIPGKVYGSFFTVDGVIVHKAEYSPKVDEVPQEYGKVFTMCFKTDVRPDKHEGPAADDAFTALGNYLLIDTVKTIRAEHVASVRVVDTILATADTVVMITETYEDTTDIDPVEGPVLKTRIVGVNVLAGEILGFNIRLEEVDIPADTTFEFERRWTRDVLERPTVREIADVE